METISYIEIQDLQEDTIHNPLAVIHYQEREQIDTVDIIASVRRRAINIGHPAILAAIMRWEMMARLDPKSERGRIARDHLRSVSNALTEGIKARALSVEDAFVWGVKGSYWLVALREYWRHLKSDRLKRCQTQAEKVRILTAELLEDAPLVESSRKQFAVRLRRPGGEAILRFLQSPQGRKFLDTPGRWESIRNAFLAWAFDFEVETVKTYLSKGNDPEQEADESAHWFFPMILPEDIKTDQLLLVSSNVDKKNSRNQP